MSVENTMSPFPDFLNFENELLYLEALNQWKKLIIRAKIDQKEFLYPSAFFSRPFFFAKDIKYRKDFPKPIIQVKLLKFIHSPFEGNYEEYKKWVLPKDVWKCWRIDCFPNPDAYEIKDDYFRDCKFWLDQLNLKVHEYESYFRECCFLKGNDTFIDSASSKCKPSMHLMSTKEIGDTIQVSPVKLHIERKADYSEIICINDFYQQIACNTYEFTDSARLSALKSAYMSSFHLMERKSIPSEVKNMVIYGCDSPIYSRIQSKFPTYVKPIPVFHLNYYLELEPNMLSPVVKQVLYELISSWYSQKIPTMVFGHNFIDSKGLFNMVLLCREFAAAKIDIIDPFFEHAAKITDKEILKGYHVFLHVYCLKSLVQIFGSIGKTDAENSFRSMLRVAEKNLSDVLKNGSDRIAKMMKNISGPCFAYVSYTIFFISATMNSNITKGFFSAIGGASLKFVSQVVQYAPSIQGKFFYRVLKSDKLHLTFLNQIILEFSENTKLITGPMITFCSLLFGVKGNIVPNSVLMKCEWATVMISHIFNQMTQNDTIEIDASELCTKIIKFIVRVLKAKPKLTSKEWKENALHICGILVGFMQEHPMSKSTFNELQAISSLIYEPSIVHFFYDQELYVRIVSFLLSPNYLMAKTTFKIIRRMSLHNTKLFFQMTGADTPSRSIIINSLRSISVPLSIELIKLISKMVEKYLNPDPKKQDNSQIGFLFMVVSLPSELVSLFQILHESSFIPKVAIKKIQKYQPKNSIASRLYILDDFIRVLNERKSVSKLILNAGNL